MGIHHLYPGNDYDDLMSGVDATLDKGFVNKNRLYVTGGSGGGLLTEWITVKTDRFQAAASFYPVTNWVSAVTTTDIPSFLQSWFPGSLWENPEAYQKFSPLYFADKVKTPTLIMSGDNDWRTPFSEAEQWFGALRLNNVDAVLARVPGESHGSSGWRPSHQIEKVESVKAWFNRYSTTVSTH